MQASARRPSYGRSETNYWPAVVDLLTSIFMVFILVSFVQTALNPQDLEALTVRSAQERFLTLFRTEFDQELRGNTISIQRRLNFLQITFGDGVLFKPGKYVLADSGRELLARCARTLKKGSGTGYEQIQIEGHTDDHPYKRFADTQYPRDNWDLSAARALTVVRFLSEGGELDARVFSANGYADTQPVASNATEEGRARNRRIEVRLLFSVGRKKEPR